MKSVILFLLVVGFVSAVDVDFDCPDEIFAGEEFECSVEVFDGGGVYDLKVDLDGERNSVLEIWDGGDWISGYYYLNEFVEDGEEEDVLLRVSESGNYDGVLKLRQDGKRDEFDFEMRVREKKNVEAEEEVVFYEVSEEIILKEKSVILLNGEVVDSVKDKDEILYESKNGKVWRYLVYGFVLFLIFVIGVLVWERF